MPKLDLVVRSRRVVTPDGVIAGAVAVSDGRVRALRDYGALLTTHNDVDLGAVALLPGCVDTDVVVRPPARAHSEPPLPECYARVVRAGLLGGVTTMAVAPAPARPAITTPAALRVHRDASWDHLPSIAFLGGIGWDSTPAGLAELAAAGVVAFQCSLSDGGAPELPALDQHSLRVAMDTLAKLGVPLLVHTEDAATLATADTPSAPARRPPRAERRGLERVISAARASGTRTHVTPFTAAECAALIAAARPLGVVVGAHTCPHYLCLPAEQAPPGSAGDQCRPPLRPAASRAALWDALIGDDPVITTIGSGHRAGIVATLPFTLSALWTAAVRRGLTLTDVARWTSERPARLLGLSHKGAIAPGADADLVAFCPDTEWRVPHVDSGPYAGRWLTGRVLRTWVGGRTVPLEPPDDATTRSRQPRHTSA